MYRKPFFIVLFTIIILLSAVLLFHGTILKWTIAKGAEEFLGLHLKMKDVSVRLLKSDFQITGLAIAGPRGFENERMIAADAVYVDFDWKSVFNRRPRLNRVLLVIPEVTVVRNAAGAVNFEEVERNMRQRASGGKKTSVSEPKGRGGGTPVFIELASVRLGTVRYKDYVGGSPPFTQTFPIPVSEIKVQNVTWEQLAQALGVLATVGKSSPGPLIKALAGAIH